MARPEVTGATFPGSESAQMTLTPICDAASKSTPAGVGIGSWYRWSIGPLVMMHTMFPIFGITFVHINISALNIS